MTRIAIGFTGTRHGLTAAQRSEVMFFVALLTGFGDAEAHHGDCVGGDAEFHDIARRAGARIVVHPGPDDAQAWRAGCVGDERRAPLSFMQRNRNIVLASTVMIAAPYEETQQPRGGTWRTVEMARSAKRPLALVLPSGVVIKERWR